MWDKYIDNKLIINSAKEAEEYYFECIRRNINNKIKQACENGDRKLHVNFYIPEKIKEEIKSLGYKLATNINNKEELIIW